MVRRRHEVRDQLFAVLLLGGFLLLTGAPLCGGPADVDALACCKRHECHSPMPEPGSAAANHTAGRYGTFAASNSSNPAAEDCCRLGSLVYPAVKNQSSVSAMVSHTVLPAGAPPEDSRSFADPAACLELIHAPPAGRAGLYLLYSSYRI